MDMPRDHTLGESLVSALDWWREAGVDGDFADEPRNWLEKPEAPAAEAPAAPNAPAAKPLAPAIPPLGGDRAAWPDTLDAFAEWWRALEMPGSGPAVAPRGEARRARADDDHVDRHGFALSHRAAFRCKQFIPGAC